MAKRSGTHAIHKLTALKIERTKKPGWYADGGNLYLQVDPTGGKSWLFRYMIDGKARSMGLGSLRGVSVEAAREAAKVAREQVRAKVDPIDVRNTARAQQLLASASATLKTWEWCARYYVEHVKVPELRNSKHAAQWLSTLEAYTFPELGSRPIESITVQDVHGVLAPIWLTINETASRLRGRIESVLGWAKTQGYRDGDNPAAWRGNLIHMLPKPAKVQDDEHMPALPFERMPAFMAELHHVQDQARRFRRSVTSSLALEFAILTAQRTGPIILAEWSEIDIDKKVWESPKDHMKRPYPHRAPLPQRALAILEEVKMYKVAECDLVFQWYGRSLHATSLLNVVANMDERKPKVWIDPKQGNRRIVPHGFRSSFMDWAHELHEFDSKALDLALAHAKGDMTEAAYRRADMLKKRVPIMNEWARHCYG